MSQSHQPVLFQEIIHALRSRKGGRYVDATVGAGGHARGILEASAPDGMLLGLDVDPMALALARENLAPYGPRLTLVHASYLSLPHQLAALGWDDVQGIMFDLGASSMQFDSAERGFSFRDDGPLDMRFDTNSERTAADLVNGLPESELAAALRRFGEEPRAASIARAIVRARPLHSTLELAEVVERTVRGKRTRVHPATRVFQALRIAVNDELDALARVLPLALAALRAGGRLAVISFHSLEDRTVKVFFRSQSLPQRNPPFEQRFSIERGPTLKIIGKKPVVPSEGEIAVNPRARSAKLRVAEKL